jgi:hypothetical protein
VEFSSSPAGDVTNILIDQRTNRTRGLVPGNCRKPVLSKQALGKEDLRVLQPNLPIEISHPTE